MPLSGIEPTSHGGGGEYRFFRQVSRDRLLIEMVGSTKTGDARSGWKVLIMDKLTLKVMSHTCKMADITDQDISLVEDLFKRREPMPSMDAVYFIQPTKENVVMFLSDMSGREPLYRKAYVFFSTHVPKELVNHIKSDTSVLPRIGALREMNLEYFPIDSQAFVTDQERVLQELYSGIAQNSRGFDMCMNTMATRISTVFASLNEFPSICYQATSSSSSANCETIPQRLASAIWDNLMKYKTIPSFPQSETCELLILERSTDQIAPVIHEWTYEAMCHDLLDMDGNSYTMEVETKTGGHETKVVHLDDNDLVWMELRHTHIADASERLHDKMTTFTSKNKAALMQQNAKDGSEISVRDLQKVAQSLPKYNEVKEKLSLHVEIAGSINKIIREDGLRELGQLEQDLVFGSAGAKDVINFLRTKQDASPENKLRLLMIYACVYPEKFEGDKAQKLMQLAKLSKEDMKVINNMRLLGGTVGSKQTTGSFSLKFDSQKTKQATRKDRTGEEETWQLFKFYPMMEELVENMIKGELSKEEYVFMSDSNQGAQDASKTLSVRSNPGPAAPPERKVPAHSMRSRRTATWAKQNSSDDGYSSDSVLKEATKDFKRMGRRIFVFIIGGATRSEIRACYKLTEKLKREVILGTSSLDDPPKYITKLKMLSETEI